MGWLSTYWKGGGEGGKTGFPPLAIRFRWGGTRIPGTLPI